jgi:DNA mismatch repair protein MutL
MGYGELVPRGRYPLAIVHVEVPDGAVDVNVHPQKLEVRFSDASAVCAAVRHVVQAGVASAPWRADQGAGPIQVSAMTSVAPPKLPFDGHAATPLSQRYAAQLRQRSLQGSLGLDSDASSPRSWVAQVQQQVRASRAAEAAEVRASERAVDAATAHLPVTDPRSLEPRPVAPATAPPGAEGSGPITAAGFFASLRYLGQLDLTYLVCDGDGELVLVDQHAAHERVELERLRARRSEREVAIQRLLFPVTIDVSAAELELVGRVAEVLAQVGFEVEPFGKATLAVKAVPAGIRHGDPTQLLRRLLAEWASDGAPSEAERVERVLAEIACHSVVRAGDRLAPNEAEALLRALDGVAQTAQGPHGRPILLRMSLPDIARRFGR